MTKLEVIQRKIQELKLYKKYLLTVKAYDNLNNNSDKNYNKK